MRDPATQSLTRPPCSPHRICSDHFHRIPCEDFLPSDYRSIGATLTDLDTGEPPVPRDQIEVSEVFQSPAAARAARALEARAKALAAAAEDQTAVQAAEQKKQEAIKKRYSQRDTDVIQAVERRKAAARDVTGGPALKPGKKAFKAFMQSYYPQVRPPLFLF